MAKQLSQVRQGIERAAARRRRNIDIQQYVAAVRGGAADIVRICRQLDITVDEYREYCRRNANRIAKEARQIARGASVGVVCSLETQAHEGSVSAAKILLEIADVYTPGARVDLTSGGQALGVVLMPSKVPVGAPVEQLGAQEGE